MNYHTTMGIYFFDGDDIAQQESPLTTITTSGSMGNAKRKAHQKATKKGYKAVGNWKHANEHYATREYLTEQGFRRLLVVERS